MDALLKLPTAKAFDKKTTILQYVIMVLDRNDASALDFPAQLKVTPLIHQPKY